MNGFKMFLEKIIEEFGPQFMPLIKTIPFTFNGDSLDDKQIEDIINQTLTL